MKKITTLPLLVSFSVLLSFNSALAAPKSINGTVDKPASFELAAYKSPENRYHYRYDERYTRPRYNNSKRRYKPVRTRHHSSKPRGTMPSSFETNGESVFVFDPKRKMWGAYNRSGSLVKSGDASGGRNYCPDVGRPCLTPRGSFRVRSKGAVTCKSSKYPIGRGGALMPYCMFFHRGYAIHGAPNVPNYNASHGCIRVRTNAANWLSKQFIKHGTKVIVRPY